MPPIYDNYERLSLNIFLKNGGEERFQNIIDISINGYYATILASDGLRTIPSKDISSIHIFKQNPDTEDFNLIHF